MIWCGWFLCQTAKLGLAMIHFDTMLTYVVVVLGLFLIPGPAVLLVLARSSVGGHRVGIATGLGIATGDMLHTATATLGLSAVLMTSALAFSLMKYAGAGYLIYLGVRALMERGQDYQLTQTRLIDAPLAFRQAVIAEVFNPKTALFFLAFLPQFVRPERGSVVAQLAVLGLVFVIMSAIYTALIALAAGQVAGWLARHRSVGRWQGRIIGAIYVGLGVRMALQQR
ncbi:threonine/homoserine/homoserine lactone efflux protein [Bradyrhizobium stylosanthis]|uniref:Threonine/homoserine/homoserine lactone efflux protein n=2 Tax=Bradyrhizobium stylosanthis TaxID=1803665 RepID=A0A560E2G7_9BRAD|nr:threonine/homoserine/homoserine lactone efflux protein [Bradyrhizobium stylosanthis]